MKQMGAFLFLLLLWLRIGSFWAYGEEIDLPEIPLPESLTDRFGQVSDNAASVVDWLDAKDVFSMAKEAMTGGVSEAITLLFSLLSVLALTSIMESVSHSVENKGLVLAVGYLSVLLAAGQTLERMQELLTMLSAHLDSMNAFAAGVIPVYSGICASAGMGTLAASGSAGLTLSLSFAALLSTKVLFPLLRVCFLLDFCASVSALSGFGTISAAVRRFFVGLVGCVGALLTAVFAFQTQIAAKADTLAGRTVRYVTQTALPLVGGALSEASRTLSSAFSLMGGIVGGVGVAVVVLLLLPVLIRLWLLRQCFLTASGMAEILSCPRIASLYRACGGLLGALMATVSLVDAVWLFEFAVILRM